MFTWRKNWITVVRKRTDTKIRQCYAEEHEILLVSWNQWKLSTGKRIILCIIFLFVFRIFPICPMYLNKILHSFNRRHMILNINKQCACVCVCVCACAHTECIGKCEINAHGDSSCKNKPNLYNNTFLVRALVNEEINFENQPAMDALTYSGN